MNKWTWLALAAFVAVLGASYYLLSSPKGKSGNGAAVSTEMEMDVEDFDAGDDSADADKSDNTYDMLDDPDAAAGTAGGAGKEGAGQTTGRSAGQVDVETIDDEDDAGETVKDPVVIEDDDDSVKTVPPTTGP